MSRVSRTATLAWVKQGYTDGTRRLVPRTPPAAPSGPKRSSRTPPPSDDGNGGQENGSKAPPAPGPAKTRPVSAQPRRVKRNRGHGRR